MQNYLILIYCLVWAALFINDIISVITGLIKKKNELLENEYVRIILRIVGTVPKYFIVIIIIIGLIIFLIYLFPLFKLYNWIKYRIKIYKIKKQQAKLRDIYNRIKNLD